MRLFPALDAGVATIGRSAEILEQMRAGAHLALWRRPRPADLAWVDTLDWDQLEDLDFPVATGMLETEIADGLVEAGYPTDVDSLALCDEMASLARRFAAIVGCGMVRIRLEVIETDACRKFHADSVTARLLMTLSGPGTQWIMAQVPEAIHQLAAGDVAIFRGRLWAERPAILHRSPPIAAQGGRRLLLVIDPFDAAVEARP